MLRGQGADADHRVAQRGDVRSRSPTRSVEQREAAQAGDHAVRLLGADRCEPDLDIGDELGLLGRGLGGLVNVLGPQIVIIGGGVAEALGHPYLDIVRTSLREQTLADPGGKIKIELAALGDDAEDLVIQLERGQVE